MMRYFALILLVMLSGCAGGMISDAGLDSAVDIADVATDRHYIAGEAYKSRMGAVKSANELEIAKLQNKDSVIIKIDSKDEMDTYALMKATEAVADANKMLGDAFMVLASGGRTKESYMYAAYIAPVGAIAEGITATGNAVGSVFRTPAAGLVAGGYAVGQITKGYSDGRTQQYSSGGGDINVDHRESMSYMGNDNVNANMTSDISDGCVNGGCDGVEDEIEFTLDDCIENPPGGYNDSGTPMYNDSLSCGSYLEQL